MSELLRSSSSKLRPEHESQEAKVGQANLPVQKPEPEPDVEENSEELKAKRKHPNPFEVQKKDYSRRIFEAVNPFVDVTSVPAGKTMQITGDKVADGNMLQADVLEAVANLIYDQVTPTCKSYKDPKTEWGARPIHSAYLGALWMCTRPSSCMLRAPVFLEDEDKVDTPLPADDEDVVDIQVKVGGPVVVKLNIPTPDESSSLTIEGDDPQEQQSTDVTLQTKYDFKVRVDDKRIGEPVTVLVIECEWDELPLRRTYQAAGYSMKDVVKNMRRGRYEPLFLQTWGARNWRHAVVVPQGLVKVVDGRIVDVRGPAKQRKVALDRRLKWKAMALAEHYQLLYPDGEYVAAQIFVFEKKFGFNFHDFTFDEDTDRFLSSLLRIVVGDRVLSWSVDDLNAIVEERTKILAEEKNRKRKKHSAAQAISTEITLSSSASGRWK